MRKNENSLTKKSSFLNQLKNFGVSKVIISADFLIAVIFMLVYHLDGKLDLNYLLHSKNNEYVITIITASSVLFALTITSLSLILSFSSSKFVKFINQHNQLESILFTFWLGNGAYLTTIALSVVYLILNSNNLPTFHATLFVFTVGSFAYSLANTFYILGTIIRFGHFMSAYDDNL